MIKKIPLLFALFLTSSSLFGFALNIKTIDNRTLTLEIDETVKTVYDLKKLLEQQTGKEADHQRLICKGKLLGDDEKTLEEVGITQEASENPKFFVFLAERFIDG